MENVWEEKLMLSILHGKAMGTQFPSTSHSSNKFACSTYSMGMIRDVHCSIFHRIFHISWYYFFKSHRLPILLFYKIQSEFIKALQEIGYHRVSIWLIYILKSNLPFQNLIKITLTSLLCWLSERPLSSSSPSLSSSSHEGLRGASLILTITQYCY